MTDKELDLIKKILSVKGDIDKYVYAFPTKKEGVLRYYKCGDLE